MGLHDLHDLFPEVISVRHASGVPVDETPVEELLEEPRGVLPGLLDLLPDLRDGSLPQLVDQSEDVKLRGGELVQYISLLKRDRRVQGDCPHEGYGPLGELLDLLLNLLDSLLRAIKPLVEEGSLVHS